MLYLKKKPPKCKRAQQKWSFWDLEWASQKMEVFISQEECQIVVLINTDTSNKGSNWMRSDAWG